VDKLRWEEESIYQHLNSSWLYVVNASIGWAPWYCDVFEKGWRWLGRKQMYRLLCPDWPSYSIEVDTIIRVMLSLGFWNLLWRCREWPPSTLTYRSSSEPMTVPTKKEDKCISTPNTIVLVIRTYYTLSLNQDTEFRLLILVFKCSAKRYAINPVQWSVLCFGSANLVKTQMNSCRIC